MKHSKSLFPQKLKKKKREYIRRQIKNILNALKKYGEYKTEYLHCITDGYFILLETKYYKYKTLESYKIGKDYFGFRTSYGWLEKDLNHIFDCVYDLNKKKY